jgi:hypothetical protein
MFWWLSQSLTMDDPTHQYYTVHCSLSQKYLVHTRVVMSNMRQRTENAQHNVVFYHPVVVSIIIYFQLSTVIMQQYQDLNFNSFKIRHCTTCFGLLGHHQVRWSHWSLNLHIVTCTKKLLTGVGLMIGFISLIHTAGDYTLQFTITKTHTQTHTHTH